MQRRKICRYFERGSCRKDNCPFVHLKQNRKTCTFYLEGECRKGTNCNFYHPPKEEEKLAIKKEQLKTKIITSKNKVKQQQYQSEEDDHPHQQKVEIKQQKHQQLQKTQNHLEDQNEEIELPQDAVTFKISQKKEEETHEEIKRQDKVNKINFLLGLNQDEDSSQESEHQNVQNQHKDTIQFVKIYPKKFPDHNKTAQMKQKIKKNEAILFKGQKYLDLISKLTDPKQKQYYQIIRKFTDHFTPQQGQPYRYTLKIRPLLFEKQIQLHFQFQQQTLDLHIDSTKYPQQRTKITILNPSIPQQYKQKFLEYIQKYHKNKPLFDTLKFIQNNFQKLYKESHFKLENQFYSRKQLENKIKKQIQNKEGETQSKPTKKKIKTKIEKNINPFVYQIKYKQGEKADHLNYNYQLTTEQIILQNCQYLLVQKLLVYLECVCEQKIMYIFDTTNDRSLKVTIKLQCKKCQNIILFGLERDVVQVRRESFGRIGVNSGHLIDIGGIGFKIGCSCNNQISKGKIFLPGERISANCHNCFQSMHISYMGLKFYNPTLKIPQIKTDTELANKGSCKHIKLSFRWYRYGCCGRCFSCDDCHILDSVAVHQKIKGITMLCGFCSREQPIHDQCSYCHKQLVKGVDKTGHWQGGFGCRDQTNLSRKDNKKYTGLTKKKQKQK